MVMGQILTHHLIRSYIVVFGIVVAYFLVEVESRNLIISTATPHRTGPRSSIGPLFPDRCHFEPPFCPQSYLESEVDISFAYCMQDAT